MAKKASSAYCLWLGENRVSITKAHGLKRGSEVAKKVGELWKSLGPADKKKYEDLAAKDKMRYEEEVKTLGQRKIELKKDDKDGKKEKKDDEDGKKRKKDKEAPKRPMSAYFLWTQVERESIMKKHGIEKAGTEYTKKAAEEWKSVIDAIKKDYEKKAAAAKAQYSKDLEAYKAKKAGHEPEDGN